MKTVDPRYKPFTGCIERAAAGSSRAPRDVFADAVHMMACSIWGPFCTEAERAANEADFAAVRANYNGEEYDAIREAFACLMDALEEKREEFLGHVMEKCFEANNKHAGQYLTPNNVASMMASILADEPSGGVIRIGEPCCGAGVMVIAQAESLRERGWEQGNIWIDAGDIDGRAVDMTYVQLSLLGYAAVVRHRNALTMQEFGPTRLTPGVFMHGFPMRDAVLRAKYEPPRYAAQGREAEETSTETPAAACGELTQLELF